MDQPDLKATQEPNHQGEFHGLVAVVTGAAQGIGRAIAQELHARGARLLLLDRNASALAETAADLRTSGNPAIDILVADLEHPAAIDAISQQLARRATRIDILVNNAGIEFDVPFVEVTSALFDRVIAVNLRAPLLLTQALASLFPPPAAPSSTSAPSTPATPLSTPSPTPAPRLVS